jgi:hypothetical protein
MGSPGDFDLGDVGVAWMWDAQDGAGGVDVAGFVRWNVAVLLERTGPIDLLEAAREIDDRLRELATCERYEDGPELVFGSVKQSSGGKAEVNPGSRLDLAIPPIDDTLFFRVSRGSVNRDRLDSAKRYYRAPLEPGGVCIECYRVGAGIVPAREALQLVVR